MFVAFYLQRLLELAQKKVISRWVLCDKGPSLTSLRLVIDIAENKSGKTASTWSEVLLFGLRNFFPKMKITPTNIYHFRVCLRSMVPFLINTKGAPLPHLLPKKSSHMSISTQKFTFSTYKCTMKPKNKPTTHFLEYIKFRKSWTKKSLGQSERNFNSMRFTSSLAKGSAVFLQIHVPSPLPSQ